MTKTPCLEHGDINCHLCYNGPVPVKPSTRAVMKARRAAIPRRALAQAQELSLEDRVNLKVLYPILDKERLGKDAKLGATPLTEEELDYLIENRL